MGGWGSGPACRYYGTVQGARHLDVLRFHREGALRPGYVGGWRWTWRDRLTEENREASIGIAAVSGALLFHYRLTPAGGDGEDLDYRVGITRTRCYFGGEARPWFCCPNARCGRRCRFLYQSGKYYVCRTCARLTYASRQASRNVSDLARLAGVSMFQDGDPWEPSRRLFYRLVRTRDRERRGRLERRIDRLEALRQAENAKLARLIGQAVCGGP